MFLFALGFIFGVFAGIGILAFLRNSKEIVQVYEEDEDEVSKLYICGDCMWFDPGLERCQLPTPNRHVYATDDACENFKGPLG